MKMVNKEDNMFAEERIENQELYCHNCGMYVQFPIDLSMDGNHVLHCPNCNHEHCRVVVNGIITSDRWAQRNGAGIALQTYQIRARYVTSTNASSSDGNSFTYRSFGTYGTSSTNIYTATTA